MNPDFIAYRPDRMKDGYIEGSIELTEKAARQVRRMRVENRWTWRKIAFRCYLNWEIAKDRPDWWIRRNDQYVGMILCRKAAKFFGEDLHKPGWEKWW